MSELDVFRFAPAGSTLVEVFIPDAGGVLDNGGRNNDDQGCRVDQLYRRIVRLAVDSGFSSGKLDRSACLQGEPLPERP